METKKHQMSKEQALAKEAEKMMPEEPAAGPVEFTPGQPLPDDFVNPPPGDRGHKCLDPQGRYQPDWVCLKIHKSNENMPQRQYFNMNGKSWYVQVGVWVDVPQAIITILNYTEQQIISMDMSETSLQAGRGVPQVVDVVPRFSYRYERSA